jgi:hypothetical protein
MISGFTQEVRGRFRRQPVSEDGPAMTIHRWGDETGRKAIVSSPFTRRSILGRYRIFAIRRLQQKADASEWDKSVPGFIRNGSCQ